MQVLESTDKITPKSVLRHRPIGDSKPPKKRSTQFDQSRPSSPKGMNPVAQRASRPGRTAPLPGERQKEVPQWQRVEPSDEQETITNGDDEQDDASTRVLPVLPKTPVRRSSPGSQASYARVKPLLPKQNTTNASHQIHPLIYLGIGMLSMVVLWTVLSGVIHWANVTLDDLRYGRPRTAQYDVAVGHSDSAANPSHFIVINLNRRIEVIEFPAGDPSHAHIYLGPQLYGPDDDLTPATLSFVDVNGDHKLDMILNVQQSHIVFINDQGSFRQPLASERHQIDQFLQHWQP